MLTQIDVQSENSFFVPILGATPKESLLIRKVTGLLPPDPSLFIGEYARDGGTYQGRRVAERNVVITLDLNPNPALGETVSGLREKLYRAFMEPQADSDHVKIDLHDDLDRVRYLVGYTEKFDGEVFDSDTMVQISLMCPDPFIRDNEETLLIHPTGWISVPFAYSGTARTGFQTKIKVLASTNVLTLENNGRTMVFNRAFASGDVVTITTVRGSRFAIVDPLSGPTVSILASLSTTSPWLELHTQANTLTVYGNVASDLVAAITELRFVQAYWGV